MFYVTIASLIVAIASLFVAINAGKSATNSEEISLQSLKWIKEPQPFISYSTNYDYINGRIDIEIYKFYLMPNTSAKDYLMNVLPMKLTLYNSGMAPLMSPKLFINLTADNINNTFPFKIYKVDTPLDKMYYNEKNQEIVRSIEFMGKKADVYGPNSKEFPPYFRQGKVYYDNLVSSHYNFFVLEMEPDLFGPFMIGTIEPGKKIEIEVWLFAIADKEFLDRDSLRNQTYTEYKTGNLTLLIESDKIMGPSNKSYNYTIKIPIRAVRKPSW